MICNDDRTRRKLTHKYRVVAVGFRIALRTLSQKESSINLSFVDICQERDSSFDTTPPNACTGRLPRLKQRLSSTGSCTSKASMRQNMAN